MDVLLHLRVCFIDEFNLLAILIKVNYLFYPKFVACQVIEQNL